MRGDGFAERQEPDFGFVLLAVLPIEFFEDFFGRLGGAKHLVEQGQRGLIYRQFREVCLCFEFGPRLSQRGSGIDFSKR